MSPLNPFSRKIAALRGPVRGAAWMTLAALGVVVMAVLVRQLAVQIHPFEIALFRTLIGLIFLMPLMVRAGRTVLHSNNHRLFALRGVFSSIFLMCFFPAIAMMEIADAQALNFTEPLFGALLAVLFLGEPARPGRIAALLVGFCGALIILRPGVVPVSTGAMLMVAAAFASGASNTINKHLTRTDRSTTIVFYHAIYMTPAILIASLFVWTWPTPSQFLTLTAIGALGLLCQISYSRSFAVADATVVLPFHFTRLPFAAVLGYVVFAELSDIWVWVGGAIIFSAIFYISRSESRAERMQGRSDE